MNLQEGWNDKLFLGHADITVEAKVRVVDFVQEHLDFFSPTGQYSVTEVCASNMIVLEHPTTPTPPKRQPLDPKSSST